MAVGPINNPVSLTHNIRYTIIRSAAGINNGVNYQDLLSPNEVTTLAHAIGKAGIDTSKYAIFFGLDFNTEYTNRSIAISNIQDICFVHRSLLNIPAHLLIEKWNTFKW